MIPVLSVDAAGAAEKATSGFDPVRWAQAAEMLSHNKLVGAFLLLIFVFILCKWWPLRQKKAEE